MVKKAVPPTVTVKPGYYKGVSGYVVRVAGEPVGVYSGENGYREALRYRDKVLAEWKEAQRAKPDVAQFVDVMQGRPLRPYQQEVVDYLEANANAKLEAPRTRITAKTAAFAMRYGQSNEDKP